MAQFTPESLARVLSQVEREVLAEAAETAGIDPLLTTPRGETLDEIAEWLNFISNMLVLAPAIDKIVVEQAIREMIGAVTFIPPGAVRGIRGIVSFFADLMEKVGVLQESIDKVAVGDVPAATINVAATRIARDIGIVDETSQPYPNDVIEHNRAVRRIHRDAAAIIGWTS